MTICGDIPYMIELKQGRYATACISFEMGDFNLTYEHLCLTNDDRIMAFRTKEDAENAAAGNGWKYMGGPAIPKDEE